MVGVETSAQSITQPGWQRGDRRVRGADEVCRPVEPGNQPISPPVVRDGVLPGVNRCGGRSPER